MPDKADKNQQSKPVKKKPAKAVFAAPAVSDPEQVKLAVRTAKRTWGHRQPKPVYKPLPKARVVFWTVLCQLKKNWKLFGGIVLIYGLLNILLVRGLTGSSDLTSLKDSLDGLLNGFSGKLLVITESFASLLATSGSGNTDVSGAYQTILLILCSLACIWALRQVLAGTRVRTRDSFYRGMYPLIPFLLVLMLFVLQLLPVVFGMGLYGIVTANGIAVNTWQRMLFFIPVLLLGLWTLRMITATGFALYIVTLPDMTPLRAYRSARQLVYGRRLLIWRKLVFLVVAMFLLAVIIEAPLILWLTPVATWVFFVLSMLALPIVHAYLYNLYREML